MAVRLPRLLNSTELVDDQRRPSLAFQRYWQSLVELIERAINAIAELTGITDQLDEAIKANQEATREAREAAAAAKEAADQAAVQADATKREAALQGSYVEPASNLSATPTTITISGHTRRYADGASVTVNGGTVLATGAGDTDYISYVDKGRVGGSVTYIASTTPPTQTGDTHVVGAVMIPTTGEVEGGEGPRRPGYVAAKSFQNEE